MLPPAPLSRRNRATARFLRAIPANRFVIAADAHWTLFTGGSVPSKEDVGFYGEIHERTEGGLVLVSGGKLSKLDEEVPGEFPAIGRSGIEYRLKKGGPVEYAAFQPLAPGIIGEVGRLVGHNAEIKAEPVPPKGRPSAIFFELLNPKPSDELRLGNMGVIDDQIGKMIEGTDMKITPGWDHRMLTRGRADKGIALNHFIASNGMEDRAVVALGDSQEKDGPMFEIAKGKGCGFMVNIYNTDVYPGTSHIGSPLNVMEFLHEWLGPSSKSRLMPQARPTSS